jgi:argininosuccinate synthase
VYGEAAGEWTAADALGFSKIAALPGMFHRRAGGQERSE